MSRHVSPEDRAAALSRILDKLTKYPVAVHTPFSLKIDPGQVREGLGVDFLRLPRYSTKENLWWFTNEFDAARFKRDYVK